MKKILYMVLILGSLISCGKNTDSPGYKYFNDMEQSPAIKAYDVDHDTTITCKDTPEGTIPYVKKTETK